MTALEHGVRWESAGGSFIAAGYTLSGAEAMVAHCCDPKAFSPHAVEVMVRDVGRWRPAETNDAIERSTRMTEPLAASAVPVDLTRLEALVASRYAVVTYDEWLGVVVKIADAAPQLLAASRAVERVRALHRRGSFGECSVCCDYTEPVRHSAWPCPTGAALDGAAELPPGVIREAMMGPFDD